MSKEARNRVAQEAARLIVSGAESEYLDAKERAIMMLGLSSLSCLPTNSKVKEYILQLTKEELGVEEVARRLQAMRETALAIMEALSDYDPFLIGSVVTGKIRDGSDIDIHAYCDSPKQLVSLLSTYGYEDLDLEEVENSKGRFFHIKWVEELYPVEITVYEWSKRDITPISSVSGKPMKRLDIRAVKRLVENC